MPKWRNFPSSAHLFAWPAGRYAPWGNLDRSSLGLFCCADEGSIYFTTLSELQVNHFLGVNRFFYSVPKLMHLGAASPAVQAKITLACGGKI